VRGATGTRYFNGAFFYDPVTFTAWWFFVPSSDVTSERYVFELNADGPDGVRDLPGNDLDGEWANGADAFPSGDGAAGGDFAFRVNRLTGDATGDGRVNAFDLGDVKKRLNRSTQNPGTGSSAYSIYADIDSNGRISASDLAIVKSRLNRGLPAGEPTVETALPLSASVVTAAQPSSTRDLLEESPVIL